MCLCNFPARVLEVFLKRIVGKLFELLQDKQEKKEQQSKYLKCLVSKNVLLSERNYNSNNNNVQLYVEMVKYQIVN